MTYILNRPFGMVTAVRSRTNVVHLASGWSAFEGTRTACGKALDYAHGGDDTSHLPVFTQEQIAEAWDWEAGATPCKTCLKRATERASR